MYVQIDRSATGAQHHARRGNARIIRFQNSPNKHCVNAQHRNNIRSLHRQTITNATTGISATSKIATHSGFSSDTSPSQALRGPTSRHPIDVRSLRRQRTTTRAHIIADRAACRCAANGSDAQAAEFRGTSPAQTLRSLLASPTIVQAPACFDGLSAKLIQQAGFQAGFLSGFSVAAARAGAPDTGLLSYAEVLDSARCAIEAAPGLPIIADGDTGYGNAMNVKRTLRGFAAAGCAGVLIEDQEWPKSCGHVGGKRVVPRSDAVARIRAACDARDAGADIVVVARTDARQAESLSEALWRAEAFAEAGADALFIDALSSEEELATFGRLGGAAASVPKMANNLEGGGCTPLLSPEHLHDLGFAIVAYPLSLVGVATAAMQSALRGLRDGHMPQPDTLPAFKELQAVYGFDDYFAEAAGYGDF